ncbi:hypothetical protein BFP70_12415 [Thioclava sp. SK-1]|uniref:SH3 domain-containing protein n=1 Tax=Thioclava sp. SK-1 TaxID=1889770 RepID=UPI0008249F70|nr:SH3 domain-containing protein [Thioclava sp. SK-1]OCX63447.1 hypothetical protein BFP70_12415 [Thioclava sp. SK-1]
MLKLVVTTSAVLFVTMVIAGRDMSPEELASFQADAATPSAPQVSQSATVAQPLLTAKAITAAQSDPVALPVSAEKAAITRITARATVGPKLIISPEHRIAQPTKLDGGTLWQVSANGLNVRSGPGTSNGRVDRLSRGDDVLLVAENGGWAKIRIEGDGTEGWVAKRFLTPVR